MMMMTMMMTVDDDSDVGGGGDNNDNGDIMNLFARGLGQCRDQHVLQRGPSVGEVPLLSRLVQRSWKPARVRKNPQALECRQNNVLARHIAPMDPRPKRHDAGRIERNVAPLQLTVVVEP